MTDISALASTAPKAFLSVLRSWLRPRASETWHSSAHSLNEGDGPNVLVVDDDPVNQMLISALMESRGFVPWLAADGIEAVALASAMQFDLILMDLQMPGLDGFEATSAIRRFESNSSRTAIPIVAYSSTTPGDDVLAAHGMNGSLTKPCGSQELEHCLVHWCPTYRSAPTVRGGAVGKISRQLASQKRGSPSLR